MTYRRLRRLLGTALAATLPLGAAACPASREPGPIPPIGAPAMRLIAFDSCEDLLIDLRRATRATVGPYGLADGGRGIPEGGRIALGGAAPPAAGGPGAGDTGTAPEFSGTNNHERAADEPDMVKTDGRRIVVVDGGTLRVVDAATRRQTGELAVDADRHRSVGSTNLLLAGNHALVTVEGAGRLDPADRPAGRPTGATLLLVDLTGTPKVISRYTIEGSLVDARGTGNVARVVVRSIPRFDFPELPAVTDEDRRIRANQEIVDTAPAETWRPAYEVTTDGRTERGRVGCDRISRPADHGGTSLLSVLTFDLAASALGNGDPVSVVADGDTVYGTGAALYIADDRRRRMHWRGATTSGSTPRTDIHRFDTAGTARPTYVASGSVPGWLVNQYALSEWDGHLRVATTTGDPVGDNVGDGVGGNGVGGNDDDNATSNRMPTRPTSESAIRVLRRQGGDLVQVGAVSGLGKGEQIYSVRYIGPRGYVVTFRQTDPLYSVDLSDPTKPTVTGELKITGYSAHLQPVGDGRLIGIGQEADPQGRTQGTQISLFDVADPANPRRLARHQIPAGVSAAEYDPHALLWWPAASLLVVPVEVHDRAQQPAAHQPTAIVLRVTDAGLTRVGSIAHPAPTRQAPTSPAEIRRTLVVGDVLWTVSSAGLQASKISTLDSLGWLPTA